MDATLSRRGQIITVECDDAAAAHRLYNRIEALFGAVGEGGITAVFNLEVENARLHEDHASLKAENQRLAAFGRQIIEYAFNGTDADGGSIQALALTHGLLRQEAYDPEKHGSSFEAKPGDEWFVCVGAVAEAPVE